MYLRYQVLELSDLPTDIPVTAKVGQGMTEKVRHWRMGRSREDKEGVPLVRPLISILSFLEAAARVGLTPWAWLSTMQWRISGLSPFSIF